MPLCSSLDSNVTTGNANTANDAPPKYPPGNSTCPFPDVSPLTMADHLKQGHLTSPIPDDLSTRKADHKEESNRANDESSESPPINSNQQLKKLVEWPIIPGTSCASYKT